MNKENIKRGQGLEEGVSREEGIGEGRIAEDPQEKNKKPETPTEPDTEKLTTVGLKEIKEFFEEQESKGNLFKFKQLEEECFESIKELELKGELEDKKKEVIAGIVKSKMVEILEGGLLDGKKKKEIIERLEKGGYTGIAGFFIEEYKINKKGEKIKKGKEKLGQLGKNIESATNELIEGRGFCAKGESKKFIENFEKEIKGVYNDGIKRKKEETNKAIDNIEEYFKRKVYSGKYYLPDFNKEEKKKVNQLLKYIKEKVVGEQQLEKKEEELEKDRKNNMKKMAQAFGLKIEKDEDLDQLLELSNEINEEAMIRAVEEKAKKEGKNNNEVKQAGEKAIEELKKAKKEGGLGFWGFFRGSGYCLLALLLNWISEKIGGKK